MSRIALLTIEQFRQLYLYELPDGTLLGPRADVSGDFFISEEEINQAKSIFTWLEDLPLIEISTLTKPDTTPPTPMGVGVVIDSKYDVFGFWDAKQFKLGGFVVPLTDYNGGLAVDLAYILWQAFRDEQDKPIHETVKNELPKVWEDLKTKAMNNELVQL